jgi:Holliday junction resolvase RusA-like endonuclease
MKTPTLTADEWRKMHGAGTGSVWEARIVSDSPREVWICVPEEMPSVNRMTREHRMAAWRRLTKWTANMQTLKTVHRLPRFEKAEVRVVHYFKTNRRRDMDNYSSPKELLDAMRKAGILADDNADVLRLLPVEFQVDKERPRTEVWVREWRE